MVRRVEQGKEKKINSQRGRKGNKMRTSSEKDVDFLFATLISQIRRYSPLILYKIAIYTCGYITTLHGSLLLIINVYLEIHLLMPLDIRSHIYFHLEEQRGIMGLYIPPIFPSLSGPHTFCAPPPNFHLGIKDTIINRILNPLIISIFCG